MLATTSSRGLVVALLVSFTMAPAIVDARPVLRAQDAPPLSRSVGLSYQAAFESNGLIDRMLPYDDSFEEESFMSQLDERGLVDDTLRGLMGPLSIIPGFVQISDMLFGDGKHDKGLLGKLGGLLLTVEPDQQPSAGDNSTASSPTNGVAPAQAAQASFRYSLIASKKQKTQVYLVPVHQADTVMATSNDPTSGTNASASAGNDTMTVKMMLHMLDSTGTPVVKCASYGATPPTDMNVETCTGETQPSADSNGNATNASKQLFKYTQSTGALTPMFNSVTDAQPAQLSNTTGAGNAIGTDNEGAMSEMRMHFVLATTPDSASSSDDAGKATATTSAAPTSNPSASPATVDAAPMAADQGSQRITLGRQFAARPLAPKLNIEDNQKQDAGADDAMSTPQACAKPSSTPQPEQADAADGQDSPAPPLDGRSERRAVHVARGL